MYAQLGLVSALTLWAAGRIANYELRIAKDVKQESHDARFTVYVVHFSFIIALGLYTQYAYIFALFGLNVVFGLYWLISRSWNWRLFWSWFVAHALGGLLFAPWAPIALRASGWRPPDLDTTKALQKMTRTLLAGITLPADVRSYIAFVAVGLVLLAVFTRAKQTFIKWAALGMTLIPATLILALGIYRPAYLKFLMASVAPLGVVLALPLSKQSSNVEPLRRWAAGLLLLALVPTQITALDHLYTEPTYARDDYRGIATHITNESRPSDAILLSAPNQWEVFTYYYKGPLPVYPAPYRPTSEQADAWIEDIVTQHERLFVLFWGDTESDPERLIEPRLAQSTYKAGDAWITSIRLARYGTGKTSDKPIVQHNIQLGDNIQLTGHTLPEQTYTGGDIIPLTLFWEATATPEQRYKVFVHLLNAENTLTAQNDMEPGGSFNITTNWPVDTQITDRYGILLPNDIPDGEYTIFVGMYDFSGQRLSIMQNGQTTGDALPLTQIQVTNNE
jgi:hypothetical protein